eukprot:TRINITY_DN2832_c0_g3_i1.p1 TRINITY_DN2832_c0_g3~~TRINITY_DN2832_c0_g3_i1.p1  ORF type:complete len:368 (+),score=75.42 TRINITY_DN2832_c0_g3_i1:83-1105(+)
MRKYGVIGCGSNVVDKFFSVRKIPKAGEKGYFSSTKVVDGALVGGVTLNHLAWAGTFGIKTALLARQGDDESGRIVRTEMKRLGVDDCYVDVAADQVTSESYVIKQEDGERSILMAPGGTSSITSDAVGALWAGPDSPLAQTQIFSTEISQVPLSGVLKLLSIAVEHNVQATALDIDVSPSVAVNEAKLGDKKQLIECVRSAEILKPARHAAEELLSIMSPMSVEELSNLKGTQLAEELLYYTKAKMVALTEGSKGCSIAARNHTPFTAAPPPLHNVVDTTGAGDAFFGGLLASIVAFGNPWVVDPPTLARMAATANMAGSMNCQTLGGLPSPGTKLAFA